MRSLLGRNPSHAAVAVTEGILGLLTWEELAGVISHELSHVKHRDILIQTVASTFGAAITYLAHFDSCLGVAGTRKGEDLSWVCCS